MRTGKIGVDGVLYKGHELLAKVDMWLGLTCLSVGIVWGLQLWSIQTARGGSGSNCDHGIYSAIGVSAWICVAIFVLIVVYIVLIVLGKVENPETKRAEAEAARVALETPLDAEAAAE